MDNPLPQTENKTVEEEGVTHISATIEKLMKDAQLVKEPSVYDTARDKGSSLINDHTRCSELGVPIANHAFTDYGFENDTLNWAFWMYLYNDSWVFRKSIDVPARDMVRDAVKFEKPDDTSKKVLEIFEEKQSQFISLCKWGALYGGSIGVMLFKGVTYKDLSEPINFTKIKNKTFTIYVTDRWFGVAPSSQMVTSLSSLDYGTPKYYDVSINTGVTHRIHHSWILRYTHREAPKLVKQMLQGWGYAEGAHIISELARDDKIKNATLQLIEKSAMEIIKMAGMRGIFMGSDKNSEDQLRKRLEMVNWGRGIGSLTFLDKDDSYERHDSTLGGLQDLLEADKYLIAGALERSISSIFGETKGGLGSTDENAMVNDNKTVMNQRLDFLKPVLDKFFYTMFNVYGVKDTPKYTFKKYIDKSQDKKFTEFNSFTQGLNNMIDHGYLTPKLAAQEVMNYAEEYGVGTSLTKEFIDTLDDTAKEESEDFTEEGSDDEPTKEGKGNILSKELLNKVKKSDSFKKEVEDAISIRDDSIHQRDLEIKWGKLYPDIRITLYKKKYADPTAQGSVYIRSEKTFFNSEKAVRVSGHSDGHPNEVVYKSIEVSPNTLEAMRNGADKWLTEHPEEAKTLFS